MNRNTGKAFITQAKVEVTPAVSNLVGNAVYNDSTGPDTVELHKLTPGRRYLVQAWFMDTRKTRSGTFAGLKVQFRIVTDDTIDGTTYTYDRAPLGQYVIGIFRATDECYEIAAPGGAFQLNAIQVRALDVLPVASEIAWTSAETQAGEASVSTEGTLRYAYAPVAFTTSSGVTFSHGDKRVTDWGSGNITLSQAFAESGTPFAPDETLDLFKGGWWTYTSTATSKDNTLTLGYLKPTYEYLVQVFVADLRKTGCGNRTMGVKDRTVRFGPNSATDTAFPHGGMLSGRFTADATTKSFTLIYKSMAEAQLNAIQVREIGPTQPVRDLMVGSDWTTDGAGWLVNGVDQTGTTLWDATVGATKTAYIGDAATLELRSDVTAQAIYSAGNLTIGTLGNPYALTVKQELSAPLATVNVTWTEPIVRKFLSGKTVLAGACPLLKTVKVGNGELVLDGPVSRSLDIMLWSPGTLSFTTNRVLTISSLAGDGVLAGPGGLTLSDGAALALPAGITYDDDFAWHLTNGSTLALPANYAASQLKVEIADPEAYFGEVVVSADSTVTGKPKFTFGKTGYRAVRTDAGWQIENSTGLSLMLQ